MNFDRSSKHGPPGWEATADGRQVTLVRNWRRSSPRYAAACGALFAFLVIEGAFMVGTGPDYEWDLRSSRPVSRRMIGFVSLVFAPLVGYLFAAAMLNETRIQAGGGALVVRHQPLPWPGSRSFDAAEVQQVFGEEIPHEEQHRSSTFAVRVKVRDHDRPVTLVDRLVSAEEALFVERRVEAALGIADRPVTGEMNQKRILRMRR